MGTPTWRAAAIYGGVFGVGFFLLAFFVQHLSVGRSILIGVFLFGASFLIQAGLRFMSRRLPPGA